MTTLQYLHITILYVHLTFSLQVLPHTFTLRKPLLPGAWMAKVIIDGAEVASHAFLVLPLQFIHGRQISVQKARYEQYFPWGEKENWKLGNDCDKMTTISRELHRGPSEPYTDDDLTHLTALLSLSHPGNASAKEVISHHSNLYGPQLSQWIDELVSR